MSTKGGYDPGQRGRMRRVALGGLQPHYIVHLMPLFTEELTVGDKAVAKLSNAPNDAPMP
jgi:hypothetical protein